MNTHLPARPLMEGAGREKAARSGVAPPGATTKGSAPQRSTRTTVGLGKRVVTTTGLGRAVVVAAVAFACSLHALRPFLYSDAPSPEQEERCNVRTIDVSAMPIGGAEQQETWIYVRVYDGSLLSLLHHGASCNVVVIV